jgi:hypothetical protein
MATEFNLPEALLEIIRADHEHGIFLLRGGELIFFPA